MADDALLLDLNNPIFQRDLFALEKTDQLVLLSTLKRMRGMTWRQVYADQGLKWEAIPPAKARTGKGSTASGPAAPSVPSATGMVNG
jgi:hypothetical protein